MLTLDFETQAIEDRPRHPPAPVGYAIRTARRSARYYAWGHPEGNNTTELQARAELEKLLRTEGHVLCHNAAFDLLVLTERLKMQMPARIEDTMVLAFLADPYGDLSLKPLAERYLKMPPDERDAVHDWLLANKVVRKSLKRWQGNICKAPGDIVGRYAAGDVERTEKLYRHLLDVVSADGMREAYQREMDIMPMLIDNETRGIPIDRAALALAEKHYTGVLDGCDRTIRQTLRVKGLDVDSNEELAKAIRDRYHVALPLTDKGNERTSKDVIADLAIPSALKAALLYRSALANSLRTFMRPWLAQNDERIHVHWNQVRNYSDAGARTGRISSTPNFQNLTTGEKRAELLAKLKKLAPRASYQLPEIRSFIVAPRGWTLFGRDYSQQELRLLAHFEDGDLIEAYRANPGLDLHDEVRSMIKEKTGIDAPRKHVKTINFAKIYGAGRPKIAAQLGVSLDEASELVDAYETALPGVRKLQREIVAAGRKGGGIVTLGGRYYPPEKPKIVKGELRTFEYKLLNYLVQGSAGDQTKQAMRTWWQDDLAGKQSSVRFLLTVHDELVGMAKTADVERASERLGKNMTSAFADVLDVPSRTDPEFGTNWGEMK